MKCTHVALQVRDMTNSIAFYARYCQMRVIHERHEAGGHVVWLGWGGDPPKFVIVLLAGDYKQNVQPPWQHIGMSVESRAEVDEAFAKGQADGLRGVWPPTDAGAIVRYYCGVPDPDGNIVEFSYGERIG
jgi:catechol 2,3-dioxygenase-like lactoylglutathione lyase family enzyme